MMLASCMQTDRLFRCLLPLAVLLHGTQLPWDTTAWLMHLAMQAFPYVWVSFAQTGAYSSPQLQVSTARSMNKSVTYLVRTHKQCCICTTQTVARSGMQAYRIFVLRRMRRLTWAATSRGGGVAFGNGGVARTDCPTSNYGKVLLCIPSACSTHSFSGETSLKTMDGLFHVWRQIIKYIL